MVVPSYKSFKPASARASAAASGSSKKSGTTPELMLRRALWKMGCRYRKNYKNLPGNPDIVFVGARVVVFCDGDFWHGKDWATRKVKLQGGHNPSYWITKIERNMDRDAGYTRELEKRSWKVMRFWESDIRADLDKVVLQIMKAATKAQDPHSV
jgi:DNA mismatch endonuclease (patch repair protein)